MNKAELVKAISDNTGMTKAAVTKVLDGFTHEVSKELSTGGKVQLIGFGTFETATRAARKYRNPETGEERLKEATTVPKFKAGKALKDIVK